MAVVFRRDGKAISTGRRAPGVPMWAVFWRHFRRGRVETWGFVGSLSDVSDLGAALRKMDVLEVRDGTARGIGKRRMARACALTRARLARDPERRKELFFELADAGYSGPLT